MRQQITIEYDSLASLQEASDEEQKLIQYAMDAAEQAYAPYSKFQVGAAVELKDGSLHKGNNQENASFPAGLCAERVTLSFVHANFPDIPVQRLAIAALADGVLVEKPVFPCGVCLQFISELEKKQGEPISILLMSNTSIFRFSSVKALLPFSFDEAHLPS